MLNLSLKSPHLLAVDDDADNLAEMLEWLGERSVNLYQARSGEQALKILARQPIQAVISDWQLPGLSGIDLVTELRAQGFKGPLLICTGLMLDAEHLRQAFAAGASDYLRKPLNPVEFVARLDKSLQLYAQQNALESFSQSQTRLLSLMNGQIGVNLQRMIQLQEVLHLEAAEPEAPRSEPHQLGLQLQERFHKLMSWSRYRFAYTETNPQPIDIRQLFKSSRQAFGALAERIDLSGGTGIEVIYDPDILQRILRQLLDNALRHTSGPVCLRLSQPNARWLRIEVLDEGESLSEGDLERLLHGQNAGLGLSICQDLLGLLGSSLQARRRRSRQGSQFYFELPAP